VRYFLTTQKGSPPVFTLWQEPSPQQALQLSAIQPPAILAVHIFQLFVRGASASHFAKQLQYMEIPCF
jgi:hypothetical protein